MISRRGFLGAIAAALVAPDPDQLLWRPGARLISIPAPVPVLHEFWRPEFWRRPDVLLVLLQNEAMRVAALNGDFGQFYLSPADLKIGDTIALRRPLRFEPLWVPAGRS